MPEIKILHHEYKEKKKGKLIVNLKESNYMFIKKEREKEMKWNEKKIKEHYGTY